MWDVDEVKNVELRVRLLLILGFDYLSFCLLL